MGIRKTRLAADPQRLRLNNDLLARWFLFLTALNVKGLAKGVESRSGKDSHESTRQTNKVGQNGGRCLPPQC